MGRQDRPEIGHVGVQPGPVEAHAAQHIAPVERRAVDGEAGRVRAAMLLRVHQFHEVVADKARLGEDASGDSAHLADLPCFLYTVFRIQQARKRDARIGGQVALRKIETPRIRLADQVYDQLMDAIVAGEIGHGDRLVQERLADDLSISRTPVREALLRLEQERVLTTSPRGGFALRRITPAETAELYEARGAVEGQAARILATRAGPELIERLRAVVAREENIASPSVRAYFEANKAIHRALVEAVGNRYLTEMFDTIWNRAVAFRLFAAIETVDLAKSLGDHMRLVDAIATGDPGRALDAVIGHIADGLALQMAAMEAGRSD